MAVEEAQTRTVLGSHALFVYALSDNAAFFKQIFERWMLMAELGSPH